MSETSEDQNKAIARQFVEEVMNRGDLAEVDDFLSTKFVTHNPIPGQEPGIQGFKHAYSMLRGAFPDVQFVVEDMLADRDEVMVRSTYRGTHTGELLGIPPTGKQVSVMGLDVLRLENGKIVEHWGSYDQLDMMNQLGLLPPMGQGAD
jgi:steroid delta-isomerase-like uncharacterized protein